ncbi:matrilin-3-like [Liolophura sinensis]|uniref:matrilin-3-like n=1 Tax=Liolophura sinensis TaxID=3198878 RepID=UPI0031589EDC
MASQFREMSTKGLCSCFCLLVIAHLVTCSVSPICENGYDCTCPRGYTFLANRCEDVDECSFQNGRCQQSCVNSVGSYRCECQIGYRLSSDNHRCDDFDECSVNNGDCDRTQICVNTWGGSYCAGPYLDKASNPDAQRASYLLNTDVMIGLTIWLVLLTVLCIATISVIVTRSSNSDQLSVTSKDKNAPKNPEYFFPDFWPKVSVTDSISKRSEMGELHDVHY